MESAILGLWILQAFSAASLAAASLSVAMAVVLVGALFVEHCFHYAPSLFLGAFFFVVALFDVAKTRSYFARDGLQPLAGMAATSTVLKFLVALLEEIPKRSELVDPARKKTLSTEAMAGFWCRAIFWWVNSTLLTGFFSIFYTDDLPDLEDEFKSNILLERLEKNWHPGTSSC